MINLGAPHYAILLVLVPALAALYWRAARRRRTDLEAFASAGLAGDPAVDGTPARERRKAWLLVGAMGLGLVALLQPQWGRDLANVPRQGRDIFVLLDTSLSMLAADRSPSRLGAAKAAIADLTTAVAADGGHRLALVLFAGRATLQSPLTADYDAFAERLRSATPDLVARRGSLIGDAIVQTLDRFGVSAPTFTDFIILTDGEDHGAMSQSAARAAASLGLALHTVAIGDPDQGAPIAVPAGNGTSRYLEVDGQRVITRMRPQSLIEIAHLSDGAYVAAATGPIDLVKLYRDGIATKETRPIDAGSQLQPGSRFQWFLGLAVVLIVAEMLLGTGARSDR